MSAGPLSRRWIVLASVLWALAGSSLGCGRSALDPGLDDPGGLAGAPGAGGHFSGSGGQIDASTMSGVGGAGHGAGGATTGTGGKSGVGGAGAGGLGVGGSAGTGPPTSANYAINPAHDGTQPDEAIRTPLKPRWSVNISGEVFYPLIANGRLFLSFADGKPKLAAYDLQTGAVSWGPLTLPSTVSLAYDSGNLFGLDQNGNVSAWDGATGRGLWTVTLTRQWVFDQFPVATGGVVYVDGEGFGGTIYALDATTGAPRWTTDYYGGEGAPTIGDGLLYEVGGCQYVSQLNAATGQLLKTLYSTSCTGGGGGLSVYNQGLLWIVDPFLGNLIITRDGTAVRKFPGRPPAVYAGTAFHLSGGVTAIDVATGATKWVTAIDGACTMPVVAGRGGQVFVGTVSGVVHELEAATGKDVSQDTTGFLSYMSCWPMALAEGRLAYATGTGVAVY